MPDSTIPYTQRYHTITRPCFTCGKIKYLTEFRPNKRKYQIKIYKGVSLNCTECIIEKTTKEMSCIQFNFDTGKYEVVNFETKEQIIEFYKL